jgi:hypothetical protein
MNFREGILKNPKNQNKQKHTPNNKYTQNNNNKKEICSDLCSAWKECNLVDIDLKFEVELGFTMEMLGSIVKI